MIRAHHTKKNIEEIERALKLHAGLTSIVRRKKTTFYYKKKRFAIIDSEANQLVVKLRGDAINKLANNEAVTYPVPSMRGSGWAIIHLARARGR
jgi:hypothetical protein